MFDKSQKKLLLILSLIFIALVTICIYIIQNRQSLKKGIFQAPDFDENAIEGIPTELEQTWNYSSLTIQEGKNLTLCATPVFEKEQLKLFLTSDSKNNFWVKVRVLNKKKKVIGECGLIKPGYYVENIRLSKKVKSGQQLTLYVMMYEKETYQSAGAASVGIIVS